MVSEHRQVAAINTELVKHIDELLTMVDHDVAVIAVIAVIAAAAAAAAIGVVVAAAAIVRRGRGRGRRC